MRIGQIVSVIMALAILPSSGAGQCGTSGVLGIPQIEVSDDVLGRVAEFSLSNALPGAPWVWLADTSPGPTIYPFGTLCIGSSSPIILFDAIGGGAPPISSSGHVSVSMVLPLNPLYAGVPFAMQAIVVDPTAPFGLAISDAATFIPKGPRLYFTVAATASTDAVSAIDLITDTAVWTTTALGQIRDIVRLPGRRWILVLHSNGLIRGYDDETGNVVFADAVTPTPAILGKLQVTADESTAVVLQSGLPLFGQVPSLSTIDLSGAGASAPLFLPPGFVMDIQLSPATTTVYTLGAGIGAYDYTTLTPLAQVTALEPTAWTTVGQKLYVAFTPAPMASVNVFDLATGTFDFPVAAPLGTTTLVRSLRFGVTASGPTLVALAPLASLFGGTQTELFTLSPLSLNVSGQIVLPGVSSSVIENVPGTNEWIALNAGTSGSPFSPPTPGSTFIFNSTTLATLVIANPTSFFGIAVQRSNVVDRAFLFSSVGTSMLPVRPITPPLISLPIGSALRGPFLQR